MNDQRLESVAMVRRRLLKASAWMAGSLLVGGVPYERPGLRSFLGIRSAWAQPSGPVTIILQGTLGDLRTLPAGTAQNTGSDWWSLEILSPGTQLTIDATSDSFLNVELFLFAPGVSPTIGTNLLTGSFASFDSQGLAAGEVTSVTLAGPGFYTLAIEDSRPPTTETSGRYSIQITADRAVGGASLIADETAEIQAPSPPVPEPQPKPDRPDSA